MASARHAGRLLARRFAGRRRGRRGPATADPENIEALTWHAAAVLGDPQLRRSLVERGLAHAQQFSWARAAQQFVAVYEDVLARVA